MALADMSFTDEGARKRKVRRAVRKRLGEYFKKFRYSLSLDAERFFERVLERMRQAEQRQRPNTSLNR
jgi:predicted solute-binding protein